MDEPQHGQGHGDKADRDVGDGQVDDEQVPGRPGLAVSDHDPAHAQIGDCSGDY